MDITASQRATLVYLLNNGAHVPQGIADATNYRRETVSRGLSKLDEMGLVRAKGYGVHELTDRGEDIATQLEERGFIKP
jgi:Mn-dependent DtxR family transcriptional regulator